MGKNKTIEYSVDKFYSHKAKLEHLNLLRPEIIEKIDSDKYLNFIDMTKQEKSKGLGVYFRGTTWAFETDSTVEEVMAHFRKHPEFTDFLKIENKDEKYVPFKDYHSNGKIKSESYEGEYGAKGGVKWYDKDGDIIGEKEKGQKGGTKWSWRYHKNGKMAVERRYFKQMELIKVWNESGELIKEIHCDDEGVEIPQKSDWK